MRAISLSLKAFGPYWEQQTINFEDLGGESIFLITGPTGAGKTTIFDAICYALYGRASGSDRDQDSLRSHFATMEDYTEVKFQFALNQKEYVVSRSPKQYKKKERGEGFTDDPPKAILYEVKNGEKILLYSRIKEVNETLESKLGFDYEQFRKMILIPQGEFRKLISENSKEREAVLQNIFHTYFYERMSDQLKTEARTLKDKIVFIEQAIHQELSKIEWTNISPDESDTIKLTLEKLKNEIVETKKLNVNEISKRDQHQQGLQLLQQSLQHAKTLEEKYTQKQTLEMEQKELDKRKESIQETKKKLEAAASASKVIPFEEQMMERLQESKEEEKGLHLQSDRVNRLENEFEIISKSYNDQLKEEDARDQFKATISKEKQQLEYVNLYLKFSDELTKLKKERNEINNELTNLDSQSNAIERKIKETDVSLQSEQMLTKQYYEMKEQCEKANQIIQQLTKLNLEDEKLVALRSDYLKIKVSFQQKQTELTKTREEYKKLESMQKKEYAVVLAAQLDNRMPCPVCGSHQHPDKAHNHEDTLDWKRMEVIENKLREDEKSVEDFQKTYVDSKSEGQSQRLLVDKLEEEIKNNLPEFERSERRKIFDQWKEKSLEYQGKRNEIHHRLESFQQIKADREGLISQKETVKQTFDQLSKNYQASNDSLVKYEYKVEDLKKSIPENVTDPYKFELEITEKEKTYTKWINTWQQLKKDYQDSRDRIQKEKTILEEKQKNAKRARDNYVKYDSLFKKQVEVFGFNSVELYKNAILSDEEQLKLQNSVQTYEKRSEEISYTLKNIINDIHGKEMPDIEKLNSDLTKAQQELDNINEHVQLLRMKVTSHDRIYQSVTKQYEEQVELESDYYAIGELADLAHGNNSLRLSFERYVLASFLDEIILQANLRLDRMSDHRYQLIRSEQVAKRGAQSGLDLEVLDHHTGQQRSVKTLSGGEGFKASLCLALGLADVVQTHAGGVQLDTLFIDEGFGTLDEESLQQAIDCLKDLQESNRLLGIISHVPHLKSEIHAKLQITPSRNGSKFQFQFGKI
ncbi:AAA family ATPase [Virgibacillus flavescens]|uniref:AAA family ATPase n=1 Tax=Virgibacillus flavescens TaxID=1611422 RepID=UPI003D358450